MSEEKNSNQNEQKDQCIPTDYFKKPEKNLYDSLQNSLFNLKYKYKTIEEISAPGEYNFYGIIYDASLPTEEELPSEDDEIVPIFKYTCEIKIIDQTTNFLVEPKSIYKNMVILTITTDHKDYIPFITKIGEVIRVHHGVYNPKKTKNSDNGKKIQLTLNKKTKYKGNWCIFSVLKAIEPYYFSHSRYPYELQDKKIIEYFKEYIPNYLKIENSIIYPKEKLLINRNKKKEKENFETTVYVIKKVELEDRFIFFIMDESDGCELHTHKEFDYLNENEVVRINNLKVINQNVMVLNDIGNVLILPDYSNVRKNLINKLKLKFKEFFPQPEKENKKNDENKNPENNDKKEENNNNENSKKEDNKSEDKNDNNEKDEKDEKNNNEINNEEKMDIID